MFFCDSDMNRFHCGIFVSYCNNVVGYRWLLLLKKSLVLTQAECELNLPLFIVPKHLFRNLFQDNLGKLYQKGKTNLDFNEARDDGVTVTSAGPYANDLHLITLFLQAGCSS